MVAVGRHRAAGELGEVDGAVFAGLRLAVVEQRAPEAFARGGVPTVVAKIVAHREPAEDGTGAERTAGRTKTVAAVAITHAGQHPLKALTSEVGEFPFTGELPQQPVAGGVAKGERAGPRFRVGFLH